MEFIVHILAHAWADTWPLAPFLFVTYIVLALVEVAAGERVTAAVERAGAAGPLAGALAGIVPQCGFSAMGATLYASRVVTLGTLAAVFLSTSDEMLPLLMAEQVAVGEMARILLVKAAIAAATGLLVDVALRAAGRHARLRSVLGRAVPGSSGCDGAASDGAAEGEDPAWAAVAEVCRLRRLGPSGYPGGEFTVASYDEPPAYAYACGCGCEEVDRTDVRAVARFALTSAVYHTVQVSAFIFAVTAVLVVVLETVGEPALAAFLSSNEILAVFASGLVALVPNCAASVVITQLYLEGVLAFGPMMAGSLVGAGVGFLVLFRTNASARENAAIVALLYVVACAWGLLLTVF